MQRQLIAAVAALLGAAVAAPAFAADLPRPAYHPAYKAPYYVAPFSWTGFYVGINGGYGWGTSSWTSGPLTTGNFDLKGGFVGGTLGYNLQTGVWVWGIEGDFDAAWIKGTDTTTCGPPGCETQNPWLATVRGRIGYSWDRFLPYITGGAAIADFKMGGPGLPTESKTNVGWTAGAGVEYAFLGNWSAKLEYLYADLGNVSCGAGFCGGAPTTVDYKVNLIRLGVNYRFF